MTLNIYGYAGCTTVKKARDWAEQTGIEHRYMHFSKIADPEAAIRRWIDVAGIEAVFNERAQTLKKLPDDERSAILAGEASRIAAMLADPRLIKRPVGDDGDHVLTGFDVDAWQQAFA